MKLQVPFIQLPLQFDAESLLAEVEALGEAAWKPHPLGYPGNDALSLIAVNGDPTNDDIAGPMRPTPLLLKCPYLMQVLDEIGAVWGRTRLMRLLGHAEVTPHADVSYYWRERMRVHVPILTQRTVRFICGEAEVNMAAGECWIFDTWRIHRVLNDAEYPRIHLVADTVGGAKFWQHVERGRTPGRAIPGWQALRVAPNSQRKPELRFESTNVPDVMTPWELRAHLEFLLNEALPHPQLPRLQRLAAHFSLMWQSLWAQYGEAREGWPEYRAVLDGFAKEVQAAGAEIELRNGNRLSFSMAAMIFRVALADQQDGSKPEVRRESKRKIAFCGTHQDCLFDRPVFIVSPPRSGSTFLFEALAGLPNVFTVGDESHVQIEGIPELHPAQRNFDSNRLSAEMATPALCAELRKRFLESLRDHHGRRPGSLPIRMLEKTPKNALRISFLAKVFPESVFVYLHRDPRQVLASMIEAWQSGRFRTYPQLPGWPGPDWSLVLIPGWRELAGKSLTEIVSAQWETTTRILLNDLEALPQERRCSIEYRALLQDPEKSLASLLAKVEFDGPMPDLSSQPLSRYTLSAPNPDKWRRYKQEIEKAWPMLDATVVRAERAAREWLNE